MIFAKSSQKQLKLKEKQIQNLTLPKTRPICKPGLLCTWQARAVAVASGTPTSTPASTDGKEVAVVSAAGGARAAVVSRVEKTAATDANMLTYQLNFNFCGYFFYILQKSPGFFL